MVSGQIFSEDIEEREIQDNKIGAEPKHPPLGHDICVVAHGLFPLKIVVSTITRSCKSLAISADGMSGHRLNLSHGGRSSYTSFIEQRLDLLICERILACP